MVCLRLFLSWLMLNIALFSTVFVELLRLFFCLSYAAPAGAGKRLGGKSGYLI